MPITTIFFDVQHVKSCYTLSYLLFLVHLMLTQFLILFFVLLCGAVDLHYIILRGVSNMQSTLIYMQ